MRLRLVGLIIILLKSVALIAISTVSGVAGICLILTPVALSIAFTIADAYTHLNKSLYLLHVIRSPLVYIVVKPV